MLSPISPGKMQACPRVRPAEAVSRATDDDAAISGFAGQHAFVRAQRGKCRVSYNRSPLSKNVGRSFIHAKPGQQIGK
jgi:hypothetical protein